MNLLRYVLVAGTLAWLGFFLYRGYTTDYWDISDTLWWWLCVIVAGLNVVYLVCCPQKPIQAEDVVHPVAGCQGA